MKLIIKYLGLISEITNCSEEEINFNGKTIGELINELTLTYRQLEDTSFKIAQNHNIVDNNIRVTGEEIALLPPFAGG